MKIKNLYITKDDLHRLNDLINSERVLPSRDADRAEALQREIERARVVSAAKIDPDVVTMNSRVILEDLDTRQEFPFELVYPDQADLDADKVSVLAPVGTAILGYRVGDTVRHDVPGGQRKLVIKKMLYQPDDSACPAGS
ncbi:MAG: nucleoside diphosphate kinase regulator [Planctomycetaceae bacterium]|nr:nucleoside diphosphate kinase regulator [Planctomycetaceae bacterium]